MPASPNSARMQVHSGCVRSTISYGLIPFRLEALSLSLKFLMSCLTLQVLLWKSRLFVTTIMHLIAADDLSGVLWRALE